MSRYDAEDVAREEGVSSSISNHSSSYQRQPQRHFDPPNPRMQQIQQEQQQQRIQQQPPPPGEEPPGSSNATVTSGSTANASLATAAATAAAQAAAAPTGVSDSVVPDLMRVYESMIQSKTPQDTSNGSFQQARSQTIQADQDYYHRHTKADERDQDPQGYAYNYQAHQQQLDLQPYNWTYDSTSIPIPAPYHLPPEREQHLHDPRSLPRSQQQRQLSIGRNNIARSLRRRPGPPPDYRGQGASEEAGYSSSASSRGAGGGTRSRRKAAKRGSTTSLTADDDGDNNDDVEDFEIGDAAGSKNKKVKTDGRWSKRFTWPEDLHRDFVSAIFDVGLKHASPSTVLEHMPPHDQINTERIKSHLQKYRMHRQKSKQEFMSSYAATLQKLHKEGPPVSGTAISGGDVAGHLTYAALTQPDIVLPAAVVAADDGATTKTQVTQASLDPSSQGQIQPQDTIVLPRLTEQEKQSPIGHSLGYLIGLFFSLKEQLDRHRRQKELAAAEAEKKFLEQQSLQHAALHDSFANDQPHDHHLSHQQPVVAVALTGNSNTGSYNNMNPPPPPSATASSTLPSQSTTRSNLEQSSMMKREMQSQMTFQTKLRALKQQELNKYNKLAHDMAQQQQQLQHHHHQDNHHQQTSLPDGKPAAIADQVSNTNMQGTELPQQQQQQEDEYHQGTGECGTDRTALRSMSVADEEDFWNTTVVDDELFDFLMND